MQLIGSRSARGSFKYGQPTRIHLDEFQPTTVPANSKLWVYSPTMDLSQTMAMRQAIQLWRAIVYLTIPTVGLTLWAGQFDWAQRSYGAEVPSGLDFQDNCPTLTVMDDWLEYTDVDFSDFTAFGGMLVQNTTAADIVATVGLILDGALLNRVPNA